jgi:hypothetical protein
VSARPVSAANFGLNCLALAAAAGMLVAMAEHRLDGLVAWLPYRPFLPLLTAAMVVVIGEWVWLSDRGPRLGVWASSATRPRSWLRIVYRVIGCIATALLIALVYWLLPEYRGDFYNPYWQLLRTVSPFAALVPAYCIGVDRRLSDDADEYAQMGRLVCGQIAAVTPGVLRRHLLGWVIKGFFLPLMSVYLDQDCHALLAALSHPRAGLFTNFDFWFEVSYTIDLLFSVIGYTLTTRLLDSQLRSIEPTVLGWVAALVCYQPFYSVTSQYYLHYDNNFYWDTWLAPWPWLQGLWGTVIVGLSMIYGFSTVAFGTRFSNLTHRGIITGGPYRFSKHPAYWSKNLSWWLISVPFVPTAGILDSVRRCGLLLLLNGVYWLRARTEERHLSRDPAYLAYARWIDAHGWLRALGRRWPLLRFG